MAIGVEVMGLGTVGGGHRAPYRAATSLPDSDIPAAATSWVRDGAKVEVSACAPTQLRSL
jgi:hypothetical protein